MLQIVQFLNGRYGLQNTMTGIVLRKKSGKLRSWRTMRGAEKGRDRLVRQINKTLHKLSERQHRMNHV